MPTALLTATSPLVRTAELLSVTAMRFIPNQGRSVVRPAGSKRRPSAAVWSTAVPAVPHNAETLETVAVLITVRLVEPLMLPSVAEIVTVPGETAVANPVLLIVAHVVSEEAQVTELVRFSVVPLDNVPVAVNCSVSPTGKLVLAGVTAIDWSAAAVTVNPVEPLILPRVAEIVTGPGDTAEARPVLLIVAHVVSEEAQVTELVKFSVVPLDNVPVAVNCSVSPTGRLVLAGVTAID